ncbi:MAG: cyclic nucleotide-binding domain-containing protein [Proteobacteria bacterium]|nr:cyclic nucleotide-binding domain-containing protein [Pseudomonadota bacterium]
MNTPISRSDNTTEIEARISLLREISFFKDLSYEELAHVSNHLKAKNYVAGQRVLNEDQPVDGVYFLRNGEVQILVSNEQTGQEELITLGYKGECFGEMSTLREDIQASASVVCAENCQFLFIGKTDFLRYVNEYKLWPHFVNILASRLEQTNHRMTEVMRHLKQGMVQVDTNGLITGKFSMGFVRLTGSEMNKLHGASFKDLVFASCHDSIRKWTNNFSLAIMSNPEQAELIINLLPSECVFHHPQKGLRIFRITYDLCTYQKKVIGMDIGLEDVTRVRELAKKSEELEKEKGILSEIYTKPDTFRTLLNLIAEIRKNMKNADSAFNIGRINKDDARIWLGNIHSLKGAGNFLKLNELGKTAHKAETLLASITDSGDVKEDLKTEFYSIRSKLENQFGYIDTILDNMGDETRKRMTAELVMSKRETQSFESVLDKNSQAFALLQKARKIPSQTLVEGWKEELERISRNILKKIMFRIVGESIPIPGSLYDALKVPLVHLLRNCAEHGIESMEERKSAGKPAVGLITFKAEVDEKHYHIHIQDNGGGINKDRVHKKAVQVAAKNRLLQTKIETLLKENRILAILFLPGFSTSEMVTDLSGRGMGLDVVQRAAMSVDGTISMKSVPSKGTKFTLSFPKH